MLEAVANIISARGILFDSEYQILWKTVDHWYVPSGLPLREPALPVRECYLFERPGRAGNWPINEDMKAKRRLSTRGGAVVRHTAVNPGQLASSISSIPCNYSVFNTCGSVHAQG